MKNVLRALDALVLFKMALLAWHVPDLEPNALEMRDIVQALKWWDVDGLTNVKTKTLMFVSNANLGQAMEKLVADVDAGEGEISAAELELRAEAEVENRVVRDWAEVSNRHGMGRQSQTDATLGTCQQDVVGELRSGESRCRVTDGTERREGQQQRTEISRVQSRDVGANEPEGVDAEGRSQLVEEVEVHRIDEDSMRIDHL